MEPGVRAQRHTDRTTGGGDRPYGACDRLANVRGVRLQRFRRLLTSGANLQFR